MDIDYRDEGGHGTLRVPDGEGPFPAVLALGGSDGGTPQYFPDLLVPEGFACLALAYWGTPETQPWFTDIPLERMERALHWLVERPEIEPTEGRIGVVGVSRGGELALLVGATFPALVGSVVAYTPSSVVWQGLNLTLPPGETRSSWTHRGQPLPYVAVSPDVQPGESEAGVSWLPVMEPGLDDLEAVDRARIRVEQCTGPVLLVSGGDDRVWPAQRMCEMLIARMSAHDRSAAITHLNYPAAGHLLFPYSRPPDTHVPPFLTDYGGNPESDAAAHADAWPQVVACLRG